MEFPRMPRRLRLRALLALVAACAAGLGAYRLYMYIEWRPLYSELDRLRSSEATDRADAAVRLGLLRPLAPSVEDALVRALDDPDPSVRANVMYSLIRLGWRSPRLLPILAEEIVRPPAPDPFPGLHSERMTYQLVDPPKGWTVSAGGLYDNDPMAALRILRPDARVFLPMLKAALKSPARWGRWPARQVVFECATWSDPSGPELADALLAVLDDYRLDPRVVDIEARGQLSARHGAAEALARLDRPARERAVARLVADLRDVGSPRSYEAVALLQRFEGGKALVVSILRDRIRDGDDNRQRIAMFILGYFGEAAAPAAPEVLRAITGPGADHRDNLLGHLKWWSEVAYHEQIRANARSERAWESVPPYRFDLQISRVDIGVGVLKVMGAAAEHGAIGELIAMARDPGVDTHRRHCALLALGEFGPDAVEAIPALVEVIRAHEEAYLRDPRRYAEPNLMGALATAAIGRIAAEGNPEAIAILVRLCEEPDATVGPDAARAISFLGLKARPAVPALARALKDPRQSVRFWASEALGKIGGPEVRAVLPDLVAALDDEDRWVRIHAAQAIAAFGGDARGAVPKIIDMLWEVPPDYHLVEVAQALGRIGPDAAEAIPAMLASLERVEPGWCGEVRASLDRIMPRTPGATVAGLIAAMRSSDPAGRYRAAYELGRLIEGSPPSAEAVAALERSIDDPDVRARRMGIAVLGRLGKGAASARSDLVRATRDPDPSARRLAAWAAPRTAAGSWIVSGPIFGSRSE
jgi:HEAT repeat protein